MDTSLFEYELPEELIATEPAEPRDASRLLRLRRRTGEIAHHRFSDLPDLLKPGDTLVINNSRVFPARLYGRREASGGRVEALLLEPGPPGTWWAMVKPARKATEGARLIFGDGLLTATVAKRGGRGERLLRFDAPPETLDDLIEQAGTPPLPPYILKARRHARAARGEGAAGVEEGAPLETEEDRERYQTVFARETGSVAAPTAGLHFTPELLGELRDRGHEIVEITLHVGAGTFLPVTADNIESHPMHLERFSVSGEAAAALNRARRSGRRIVPVGTTCVRALETLGRRGDALSAARHDSTDLLIAPGFQFRYTNALVTNFHLPRSTLLMLVCALAGRSLVFKAYEEAVREGYRFYSYGDAMLID